MLAACGRKWRILSLALHPLFLEAVQEVRLTSDHIGSRISPPHVFSSVFISSAHCLVLHATQPPHHSGDGVPRCSCHLRFYPYLPFRACRARSVNLHALGPRHCPSALTPSVLEGASVRVIEEDDGSGWIKVVDEEGGRGLVPASYIESADVTQVPSPGTRPVLGSGQFGECHTPPQLVFPGVLIVGSSWTI